MSPRPEPIPMQRLLPAVALVLLLTGCAGRQPDAADGRPLIPALAPYRMDIRQGNVVDATMLARLQPGMDRDRVRALLGTPQLRDPFRPDRWDYTYTERKGYEIRAQRTVTLLFEGDRLVRVAGDVQPVAGSREKNLLTASTRTTVDVPAQPEQSGSRLARLIGGIGSDDRKNPAAAIWPVSSRPRKPVSTKPSKAQPRPRQPPRPHRPAARRTGPVMSRACSMACSARTGADPQAVSSSGAGVARRSTAGEWGR